MTMIGADLPRLPAGNCDVAVRDRAQDFLDVVPRVPLLLSFEAEGVHIDRLPVNGIVNLA